MEQNDAIVEPKITYSQSKLFTRNPNNFTGKKIKHININSNYGNKKITRITQDNEKNTHYRVSGGPIMVTLHSKRLVSSSKPAENPSTGCLHRSA